MDDTQTQNAEQLAALIDRNLNALRQRLKDHPNRSALNRLTAAANDAVIYGRKLNACNAEAQELARLMLDANERMQAAYKELERTA